MKKILVLGASGMLGTSILNHLYQSDNQVFAPARRDLNLFDREKVAKHIATVSPDIIYHCAALVGGIQANLDQGPRFLIDNSTIDHNVLSAAYVSEIPQLYYMGSSCMYPANFPGRLVESDLLSGRLEPTNESYALAKLLGVKSVEAYASLGKLNWTSVIASNLYGPHDNFDPIGSHLVASIIRKVHQAEISGEQSIEIWGKGTNRREFTYVEDLASWMVEVGLSNTVLPPILNVGFGLDFSVKNWYEKVIEVAGLKLNLRHDFGKPDGNNRKLMNSDLAKTFGWDPKTNPEEGIRKTWRWFKSEYSKK